MPLIHGYSRQSISANIRELMQAGKAQAQAVAIALKTARKAWDDKNPGKRHPKHIKEQTSANAKAKQVKTMCAGIKPAKSEGRSIERAVFETKGHRIDKLPCARGFIVHPDHRWFDKLRDAKKWLREHAALAPKGKKASCGCSS
ncbi:MAG: hypothetical protein EPN91_06965 [Salinibacterium sp.]|nr:MAG: hypothetical protein EPN91_06965 [Salinibacterium sp.]